MNAVAAKSSSSRPPPRRLLVSIPAGAPVILPSLDVPYNVDASRVVDALFERARRLRDPACVRSTRTFTFAVSPRGTLATRGAADLLRMVRAQIAGAGHVDAHLSVETNAERARYTLRVLGAPDDVATFCRRVDACAAACLV